MRKFRSDIWIILYSWDHNMIKQMEKWAQNAIHVDACRFIADVRSLVLWKSIKKSDEGSYEEGSPAAYRL